MKLNIDFEKLFEISNEDIVDIYTQAKNGTFYETTEKDWIGFIIDRVNEIRRNNNIDSNTITFKYNTNDWGKITNSIYKLNKIKQIDFNNEIVNYEVLFLDNLVINFEPLISVPSGYFFCDNVIDTKSNLYIVTDINNTNNIKLWLTDVTKSLLIKFK